MKPYIKDVITEVNSGRICPYCWERTEYRDSLFVPFLNKQDLGFVFVCEKCGSYVSETFPKSEIASGRLRTKESHELITRVKELWERCVRFYVLRSSQIRYEFSKQMNIDKDVFNLDTMTDKQLRTVRKKLLSKIALYQSRGLFEYTKGLHPCKKPNEYYPEPLKEIVHRRKRK